MNDHPLLKNESLRLYNLYPRLFGTMKNWAGQLDRIRDMGFNAVWVNPFHYPGFSGSLYSPKDYYAFNPMFVDETSDKEPVEQLRDFISACHDCGMLFIMDLVINHTAIDCPLTEEHRNWYKLDENGKVVNPGAMDNGVWVPWGDLAEIDNLESEDRDNLWNFWWKMMSYYLEVGVDGFRCDMAYQVPGELWEYLMEKARSQRQGCLFLAESLGCDFKQVKQLAEEGFDYLFNSVKYWDFNEPWAMEQYNYISKLVPTVAFPESHDTERIRSTMNDDQAAVRRQMLFSAVFSSGYMIPSGFEFGFTRQLNVVQTDPSWWEETGIDMSDLMCQIADMKKNYPVLCYEEGLEIVDQANWPNVFCFKRSLPGLKTVFVIMNKDIQHHQGVCIPHMPTILGSDAIIDLSPENTLSAVPVTFNYLLRPSEIKIFAAE